MSDDGLRTIDPQHHPNPQYGGSDIFVLDFIRKREAALKQISDAQKAATPKDEVTVELMEADVKADIQESNAKYAGGALKREIMNSYYNHPLILHDFATGRATNLDPGQGRGPALIVGSGPTLDEAHDLIRGWKGGLFCSSSQCTTMLALGKRDFTIVAVDVKTLSDEFMPLSEFEDKGCTLIIHPGMDPEVIQAWRWRKQYFRIIVHGMPHYIESLPIAYPMIRTTLYVYGCVAATQLMIAHLQGYSPLYLVGCDFGYPDNKSRFTGFTFKDGKWERSEPAGAPRYLYHPKVTLRNGCVTDHFQAYYKQTFFNSWRLTLADVFKVGSKGGLYEVPSVTAEELLACQGDLPRQRYVLSNRDKQDICERYLMKYGTCTFEFPSGQVEFVVFDEDYKPGIAQTEAACSFCGKMTTLVHPKYGHICSKECLFDFQLREYLKIMNDAFAKQKIPGVLILGEEKGRLKYLRDDTAWEAKEKRWQWEITSPQSPTETIPETPSASA